jgi:oligopeptidase A
VTLPNFSAIDPKTIQAQLTEILDMNRADIAQLLTQTTYTWDNLMQPLEAIDDKLHHFWSPISHLHSVKDSEALRDAYQQCLAPLTLYSSELSHNKKLYQAISSIASSASFKDLCTAQKKAIKNNLRDFKLAGVALSDTDKTTFTTLSQKLSELTTTFSNNVLDATQGWSYHTEDPSQLLGLPDYAIAAAQQTATAKSQAGYLFTLEYPSFSAVMTYADNRALRQALYEAYVTRASETGPNAGKWDNSGIMHDILSTRRLLAQLLGFDNYATYSLSTKMVDTPEQVFEFLDHLSKVAYPHAQKDMAALRDFADKKDGLKKLEPWDIGYYTEQLRQTSYSISDEMLRPYFPVHHVLNGLFKITEHLYDVKIREVTDIDTWHSDVKVFELYNEQDALQAQFFIDLYARENKRGGAWMDECQIRRITKDNHIQIPVAYLTCNFQAPIGDEPALLTHNDVVTLFHEFGHGLQHMLTQVNYSDVSGINGVPWDAVELPSQFMENFAWQKEGLDLIAKHYQTGAALPDDLFEKMQRAKNFQSAMQTVRQLEFSLFDFTLHQNFNPETEHQVQHILDDVRKKISVSPHYANNRFQHGFSHIFAGGYAAGYYSYKWAEVMAADAFSLFLEKGIFNKEASHAFKTCILEAGGSEDALELFERFRGHKPKVDALLTQDGII